MYSIHAYAQMIADRGRTDAYAAALRHRITPDSVVLDLGAGPGILSFLACEYGAGKVYAIETDDIIQVAKDCAVAKGLSDRIEFIQADSTRITLPEEIDGIVCDLHGALPFFDRSIGTVIDAKRRFLRPDGWIIPFRETVWVAVAACPDTFAKTIEIWTENVYGLNMIAARKKAANYPHNEAGLQLPLVTSASPWTALDYLTLTTPNAEGTVELEVQREETAHGLVAWFECELSEGVYISSSPETEERHVYGELFFPWPDAVALVSGDTVSVNLRATQVGVDYVWQWATTIKGLKGNTKAAFRQDSLSGNVLSAERLRRRRHQHVPSLNEDGAIVLQILELMRSNLPLELIAKQVTSTYPHRFSSWQDAMTQVGELSAVYSV